VVEARVGVTASGRRSFPLEYRIEFLRLWDECRERGAKVRLLREHGLPKETVARWVAARKRGEFSSSMVAAAERSPKRMDSQDRAELARLRAENEALKRKVVQAEAAQEILGKAFELLDGINKSSIEQGQIPPALLSAREYEEWLKQHRLS
jgi:hypothetical protein